MKNRPSLAKINQNNDEIKLDNLQLLKGKTFAIKDNYATKNIISTNGSKILEDFKITYNSTVYEKLLASGAIPITKSNMDELAMGYSGLTSAYDVVLNPFDNTKIIGGSSSGSAYLVANGDVDFAVGSDTGDSVRKPAWYVGIVGFKPTWGIVSRQGLFDFAPSWDTVGWFSNSVSDAALILDVLVGKDEKDFSSIETDERDFYKDINNLKNKNIKIGIIKSFLGEIKNRDIHDKFIEFVEKLKSDGFQIIEINLDLDLFKTILSVYRIISSVNSFSSNSILTSFLYGKYKLKSGSDFKEAITETRSNFVYEVKKRFLLSSEVFLNKKNLYDKARKIRNLYIIELENAFKIVDAIMMPPASNYAPKLEEVISSVKYNTVMDEYLGIFNANGSPSLNVPIIKNGAESFSVNIATKPFEDKKCLQIGKLLEKYGR